MLAIRLARMGSKKRPFFRVVVADSRKARDSRFVEILGYYNPRLNPSVVRIDRGRFEHWLKAGALPSDTVRTLMARHLSPEEPVQARSRAAAGGSEPIAPSVEQPAVSESEAPPEASE